MDQTRLVPMANINWQPWQLRIMRAARRTPTTLLSCPRGNGKSQLGAHLLAECLRPGSEWHQPDSESILVSGSIAQARRTVWSLLRPLLRELPNVRVVDTAASCTALHLPSGARVSVMASNSDRALGLVGCPLIVGDEPASWGPSGEALYENIRTALGKPGSRMRLLLVGTMAPHADTDWWPREVAAGDAPGRRVFSFQTPPDRWSHAASLAAANPLMRAFPDSWAALIQERDEALAKPERAAAFKRFRSNLPGGDPETQLISVESWQEVLQRLPRPADGRPTVGVDLGTAPSWSAAVAVWPSGRMSAFALLPGLPGLDSQEVRDRAPRGLYQRLVESGHLLVAHDLRAPKVSTLVDVILKRWQPRAIVADRVRANELRDAVAGRCPVALRIARWSEASFDISSFRRWCLDGGGTVDPEAATLLTYGIGQARVRSNDGGDLMRLDKRGGQQATSRRR